MQVVPLYSAEEIEARIAELAAQLYRDYADAPLTVLRVGDGATRFVDELAVELARHGVRAEVRDVRARRPQGSEQGAVQVDAFDPSLLDARDVLVVDDVVDEGATLEGVLDIVGLAEARSVRTAVLVGKRTAGRARFAPDYVGFEVDGGWVVGFGMAIDGELADLDEIGVVID
jgi:hypoxanthine phosphoribosyltransferase